VASPKGLKYLRYSRERLFLYPPPYSLDFRVFLKQRNKVSGFGLFLSLILDLGV